VPNKASQALAAAGIDRKEHRATKRQRKLDARSSRLDYAAYLGARVVIMFVEMLSARAGYALARMVGKLMYRFDKRHRKIAIEQIRRSFPDWSEKKVHRTARASICNMVCMGLELLLTPRIIRPETWRRHIRLRNMENVVSTLISRDRPMLLVTGHFGNWELAGYFSATIGLSFSSVARRIDNPYINDLIFGVRERTGQRMIYKQGAAEQIEKAFDSNEAVSIVCDQDAGARGIFVDYFDRPASTFKSIGLLAMQYDAPIAVICCRRLEGQFNFEIFNQRMIEPSEWSDKDDPLRWITQQYTSALEQAVRTQPEQYFWVHRRWKHAPRKARKKV
ncbi:MAG: lysophospholipid acyltransferase family protein, partial [bacterium]|nr:lysophospholipid acyltransferase family protein [bacterium]